MPTVDPKTQLVRAAVSVPPVPPDTGMSLQVDHLTDDQFMKTLSTLTPPFKIVAHGAQQLDPGPDWETILVSGVSSSTRAGSLVIASVQEGMPGQGTVTVEETVAGAAAGGTYTLTFGAATTPALAYNATDADIQSALNALATIGGAGGSVTVAAGLITFGGTLAGTNVAAITLAAGALTSGVTVLTESDGDPVALVNDVQSVDVSGGGGGAYTLTLGAATSAAIAYNAAAAAVQSAVQAMSTVGSGNATVTGAYPLYRVEFTGALANTDVAQMTANTGSLTATGTVSVVIDGAAGGPVNEVQTLTVSATTNGGTYTLTFGGATTSALAWNAPAATVQTALQGLSSIGAGNVTVAGANPYTLTFAGTLAATNVALVAADSSLLTAPGQSEVQTVHIDADAGTFRLSLDGVNYTAAQAYNVSAATLQTALEGLAAIGAGNVLVELAYPNYRLTFQGALALQDVALLSGDASALTQTADTLTFAQRSTDSSTARAIGLGDVVECGVLPDASVATLTLSANQNNWAPVGFSSDGFVLVYGAASAFTITGIAGGVFGRKIVICNALNIGGSITFTHFDSGNSLATNCFVLPGSGPVTINRFETVEFEYGDSGGGAGRWFLSSQAGVPINDSNLVHLTGTEGISGLKVFSGAAGVVTLVPGDSAYRLVLSNTGRLSFGSGSAAQDAFLYRSAANVLTLDATGSGGVAALSVSGNVNSGATVTGSQGVTATPPYSFQGGNVASIAAGTISTIDLSTRAAVVIGSMILFPRSNSYVGCGGWINFRAGDASGFVQQVFVGGTTSTSTLGTDTVASYPASQFTIDVSTAAPAKIRLVNRTAGTISVGYVLFGA